MGEGSRQSVLPTKAPFLVSVLPAAPLLSTGFLKACEGILSSYSKR